MCFKNLLISALLAGALPQLAAGKSPTPGWQWPAAEPATVGLDETVLAALDGDIAAGKFGYVDSLLIIRHGKLAYERSYHNDYKKIYGASSQHRCIRAMTSLRDIPSPRVGFSSEVGRDSDPGYPPGPLCKGSTARLNIFTLRALCQPSSKPPENCRYDEQSQ